MMVARGPSSRLGASAGAADTRSEAAAANHLAAIRAVWIGIGHPNRLCGQESEKKFQQGESLVDVLALAIFVHQESVALALRGARVRSNLACTKSLFHRFFFDVERNRSRARGGASLARRARTLHGRKEPQKLVADARNPRFIEQSS
jgi:hypothetical protein